ncbi:hypothetical protein Tco_1259112, partial [Tanacetum coccineum]
GIRFLAFTYWDLAYRKVSEAADQAFGLLKVNFVPSWLVSIKPAPDPSTHDDPSVNSVHGSCGVLTTDVSGGSSFGFSTKKSARISPFIDVLGRASAFLFLLLGIWLMEKVIDPLQDLASQVTLRPDPICAATRGQLLLPHTYLIDISDVSGGASSGFIDKEIPKFVLSRCPLAVITAIGCAWKYIRNLLAAKTSARTSFSIGV